MKFARLTATTFGLSRAWWLLMALVAVPALLWAARGIYRAAVIEEHEVKRRVENIEAFDTAAEERAYDAIQKVIEQRDRTEAIETTAKVEAANSSEAPATLPPTTRALNCTRLARAYSVDELAKMQEYQEYCK